MNDGFVYVWHSKILKPERKGQKCKMILKKSKLPVFNAPICVEFMDGEKIMVARNYIRLAK